MIRFSLALASALLCAPALAQEVAPDATQSTTIQLPPPEVLAVAKPAYGKICDFEFAAGPDQRHRSWPMDYKNKGDAPDQALNKATLHELFCFSGAYNISYVYMLETEADGLMPVHFAAPDFRPVYENDDYEAKVLRIDTSGFLTERVVVNPDFDAASGTLTSAGKWRGIGDASSSGTWRFLEGNFVLVHYEVDASYDGEINPTVIFDAAAETP